MLVDMVMDYGDIDTSDATKSNDDRNDDSYENVNHTSLENIPTSITSGGELQIFTFYWLYCIYGITVAFCTRL